MAIVAEISMDDMLAGALPDTSHQQRLQQTVATVAATMDAPPYNTPPEKLRKAMDLVLTGKVQAHQDGLYTVQGSTKTYDIDGECPCPQGQRQKSKWCYHLVGVELWKRVQMRLYASNGRTNGNGTTWPERAKQHPSMREQDEAPLDYTLASDHPAVAYKPDWQAQTPVHHWTDQLACVTHSVKFVCDGIEHNVTIRGDSLDEVMVQVKQLTGMVKQAKADRPDQAEDAAQMCPIHNAPMTRQSNERGSWFSHRVDGKWCKGK